MGHGVGDVAYASGALWHGAGGLAVLDVSGGIGSLYAVLSYRAAAARPWIGKLPVGRTR
jgi:hypothetical protein